MIAVIGDGINLELYPAVKALSFDLKVNRNKSVVSRGSHIRCMASSATTCAAIIKKYCPEAELGSIQVNCSENMECDSVDLIAALEWCIHSDVRLVQIAVNGFNYSHIDGIRSAIARLFDKGCVVLSHIPDSVDLCIHMCIENLIIVKANKKWNENKLVTTDVGNEVLAPAQHDLINDAGKTITTKLLNVNAASVVAANIMCSLNSCTADNLESCRQLGIEFVPLKNRILLKDLSILENEYHIIAISGKHSCIIELSLKISNMLDKHGDRCRVFTDQADCAFYGVERIPNDISISLYTLFTAAAMNLKKAIVVSNNAGIAKAATYNIIVDPKRQRNHYYNSTIYMPSSFDYINVKNAVEYMNRRG